MSDWQLTAMGFRGGVWHGVLSGGKGSPKIDVRHLDRPVKGVELNKTDEGWAVSVQIPVEAISEGVQTFVISDARTGDKLGDFTLVAGEALSGDLRVEMELLRAELDMLKRAFRRHCAETS